MRARRVVENSRKACIPLIDHSLATSNSKRKTIIMKLLHPTKLLFPLAAQLGVACSAGLLPVPAAADVYYAGIECVVSSFIGVTVIYNQGAALNPSTSAWQRLECPISKDYVPGLDNASVRVRDNHPTLDIQCALISRSSRPFTVLRTPTVTSSGTGLQDLTLAGLAGGGPGFSTFIECTLPPRASATAAHSSLESYFAVPTITGL